MALFDQFGRIAPRVVGLLIAALQLGCANGGSGPIRIGVAGPFTDPIGRPMRLAAELAAEEINARGGVGGRPLELVLRDDYANPDSAVFVAGELYDAGVSAVIGHLFSDATLAAAPVYNGGSDPVVAISPSSSAPEVSAAGQYTFRVCPSDNAHGAALAQWIRKRLGFQRGAVLYLNDPYGRGIRRTFVEEFMRLGGELDGVDPYLGDRPAVGALSRPSGAAPEARLSRWWRETGAKRRSSSSEARARGTQLPRARRRRPRGHRAVGRAGRGRVLQLLLLRRDCRLRATGDSSRRTAASSPTPAHPTSRPPRPTTRSISSGTSSPARARAAKRCAARWPASGSATPAFEGVTGAVAFDAVGDVPNQNVYIGLVHRGRIEVENQATAVAEAP